MTKAFLMLILISGFAMIGKCDTISFWHIYHNMKQVGDFSQATAFLNGSKDTSNEIVINIEAVKNNDSITVEYFCDTPCGDCPTTIFITGHDGKVVLKERGFGTFKPISFKLNKLVEFMKKSGVNSFNVFYSEKRNYEFLPEELFTLKLE